MSLKINQTILLKISKKEYELLMYLRRYDIDLTIFKPGNVRFHFDNQNTIRKHDIHSYGIPENITVDNSDLTK